MTEPTFKTTNTTNPFLSHAFKTFAPSFSDESTKDWLKNVLKEQIALVEFTKTDGSVRKMKCTLAESEIPTEKLPKNTKTTKNESALAVFDVEKQDWRSFKWDSIKSVEFLL